MRRSFIILLKNPFTLWARSIWNKVRTEYKNRHNFLVLGYLSNISKSRFEQYNTIGDYCSITDSKLGKFTYVANNTEINKTDIGRFCSIGPHVMIGLGMHPTRTFVSTHPAFYSTLKQSQLTFVKKNKFDEYSRIVIGNDVWIGARAIITDGVQIGDGAIVAANSVVTKNVPPYAIVAGAPAVVKRYRFSNEQINKLQSFQWWNMENDKIQSIANKFDNIEALCEQISIDIDK